MPALMKTNEKYSSPMSRNFKDVFMMGAGGGAGHKPAPQYTNICKFSQLCGPESSLVK